MPYRATEEKIALVKSAIETLAVGDNKDKVLGVLGPADEIRPTYHRNDIVSLKLSNKPKPTGESYWYILARDKETGSHLEKNESLVRITFSLDGFIVGLARWGRDFPDSPDTLKQ